MMVRTVRKQVRLVSLLIVVAMIMIQIFVLGGLPVHAVTDAVVNTTTGDGYGDDLEGALNAASPGDVIEVYSGEYGDIVINKPLTLIAPNGPKSVSIDSIYLNSVDVIIQGITIGNGSDPDGHGIIVPSTVTGSGRLAIDNCVFEDRSERKGSAIFIGDYESSRPTLDDIAISITNNQFSDGGDTVQIAANFENSDFLLSGNSFKTSVDMFADNVFFIDNIKASSVHIFNNTFDGFDQAVVGPDVADGTKVVIEGNTFMNGKQALSFASVLNDSSVWFSDNHIESCVEGVYIGNMGNYQDVNDSSTLIIENNRINQAIQGIDISGFYKGSVSITNNILQDCSEYGIYFGQAAQSEFTRFGQITIEKNQFLSCGYLASNNTNNGAIYVRELGDDVSGPANLQITQNRFVENHSGLTIDRVYLQNPTSSVAISHNDFVGNVYGINLFDSRIEVEEPDQFYIGLNHFSGNERYALVMNPGEVLIQSIAMDVITATHNWWGDETGPFVKNMEIQLLSLTGEGDGDTISQNIDFDPWIASLKLTVAKAQAETGATQEVTAQILDSNGAPINASGLSIVFTITGANSKTVTVPVTGLNTITGYIGSNIGTDTIFAEVIFAGEPSGLESKIEATWIAPAAAPIEPTPAPEEPTPAPEEPAQAPEGSTKTDTDPADTSAQIPVPKPGQSSSPIEPTPAPEESTQAPEGSTKTGTDPADTSAQMPVPKTGQSSSPIETALPVLMLSLLAVLLVVRHTLKQMKQG